MKIQEEERSRMLYRLAATFLQQAEREIHKWIKRSMSYCFLPVFMNLICSDISNLVQQTSLEIRCVTYLVLLTIATLWLVLKYQTKDRHRTTPSSPPPPPTPLSVITIETPIETDAKLKLLRELLEEIGEEMEWTCSKYFDQIGEKMEMGCSRCKSEYTTPAPKASSPSTTIESTGRSQAEAVVTDARAINIEEDDTNLDTGLESVIKLHLHKWWEDMRASLSVTFHQLLERVETGCSRCKADRILDPARASVKLNSTIGINGEKDYRDFDEGSLADYILKSSRYPPYSLHHRSFLHG